MLGRGDPWMLLMAAVVRRAQLDLAGDVVGIDKRGEKSWSVQTARSFLRGPFFGMYAACRDWDPDQASATVLAGTRALRWQINTRRAKQNFSRGRVSR